MPQSPAPAVTTGFYQGTGRRKEAVARVVLRPGTGQIEVNGKSADVHFHALLPLQREILLFDPFRVTGTMNQFDAKVRINGGGIPAQMSAFRLGVARALDSLLGAGRGPCLEIGCGTGVRAPGRGC